MQNAPTWAVTLSLIGLPTLVVTVYLSIVKLLEQRRDRKLKEADDDEVAVRQERRDDSWWNAAYRARVEAHLPWDYSLIAAVEQHRRDLNAERRARGEPEIDFPGVPPAPPLFPPPPANPDAGKG